MASNRKRRSVTFWLWAALGTVLVVLGSPYVIGGFLPGEYEGQVSARLAAEPQEVWATIADYEQYPLSGPQTRAVKKIFSAPDRPAWLEELRGHKLTVTTLEQLEGRRVVRTTADADAPLRTRWDIELSAEGEGASAVRIVQRSTIEGGRWSTAPLRFVMQFLGGSTMGPRNYLESLAAGLGVEAHIE